MNMKNLFKFTIVCLMTLVSLGLQAQGIVLYDQPFSIQDELKGDSYKSIWTQIYELPIEVQSKLLSNDAIIEVVIEYRDSQGKARCISSARPYHYDILRKPVIIHYKVDDVELPVNFYKFGLKKSFDNNYFFSNRKEMSDVGISFLQELMRQDSFFITIASDCTAYFEKSNTKMSFIGHNPEYKE